MSKIKLQQKQKIKMECNNCYKSKHIVFSFAYVTYQEDFDDYAKKTLIDRMLELSQVNYLELMRWDKYKGIEEERLNISKEIPSAFITDIQSFDGKYTVIRLYKSNVPTPGRVIGKIVNKVFYVFFIDTKGNLYNHGK